MTLSATGSIQAQASALLRLGLPLISSQLAQFAITMTDMIMVGWYDVTSLAGLTIAGAMFFVIFVGGSGFALAIMPLVAAAAGTDDDTQVRRVTRTGFWLSAMVGAAAMPAMIWSEPLFLWMGQTPEVAREAGRYLSLASIGMIPALLVMVLRSYLSALEHARIVLIVTLATLVLNVCLNYVLIFGNFGAPEMGVRGAALASITLQIVGLVWLGIYVVRRTPEYNLFQNPLGADPQAMVRVFRLGWPIGLTGLAEVGLFAASSVMVGWVGTTALAAHGIALQIASLTFTFHLGLSQAVTVRVGRAFGRGDKQGMRDSAFMALGISMCAAGLTVAAFLGIPESLIGLFLSPDDPQRPDILTVGIGLLAVAAVFQLVDATQVLMLGMLRGAQDTRIPMLIAAVSYWLVGISASYVAGFVLGYGAIGVWAGLVLGLALAAALLSWRFWGGVMRKGTV